MSFTDDGYEKKTEQEILEEKEELYSDLFDILNYSPSSLLWQWIKTQGIEREEIEMILETAFEQMSISTSQGVFLDKWGEEAGLERKGAQKAEGYVEVTDEITDSSISVSAGTRFQDTAGNIFVSDINDSIPRKISMTKTATGESDDYFPSSIDSVENIVTIKDANNNEIDSQYYSLNTTYNNYIEWESGSGLVKNESYTVTVSGSVTKRIEVTSQLAGEDYNAPVGTVTTCLDQTFDSVTNEEAIDGASNEESDSSYRNRLQEAKRRIFTLGKIKSKIQEVTGVRAVKVYQDTGVDQHSVADWDNPSFYSTESLSGSNMLSQEFVPGDTIATFGGVTLYGRAHNDPPNLYCGVKRSLDTTGTEIYYDYTSKAEYEIDPTETGYQDINFTLKYNGLDKTRTYRIDLWVADPDEENFDWTNNHWKLKTTNEGYTGAGDEDRGRFFKNNVSQGTGYDLMFKTHFNAAGYTAVVNTKDGYGFTTVEDSIEDLLDYVEDGGHSPVCIQYTIEEAEQVLVNVRGTVYVTELADFQNVRRELVENIEEYLEGLEVGDNVVYSKIYQVIMNHSQVTNLRSLQIQYDRDGTTGDWVTTDIGILDDEIPDIGTTSFQRG